MGTQPEGRGGCLSLIHKGDGREKAALPFLPVGIQGSGWPRAIVPEPAMPAHLGIPTPGGQISMERNH